MTVSRIFKTNKIRYSVLILLILVLFSFMIHYFNKARIHSEDVSQAEYYKSIHIAIVFLISLLIVLIFSWIWYVQDFDYERDQNLISDWQFCKLPLLMDIKYERTIYFISFLLFISSIIRYGTSVEVKSDKQEYYKRCMEGGVLLLCTILTVLFPTIEQIYRQYTTCDKHELPPKIVSKPLNWDTGRTVDETYAKVGHNMTVEEREAIHQQNLDTID
jgi:NADH:ubiquinone oxidoreductase subunit 6 (subunit J)